METHEEQSSVLNFTFPSLKQHDVPSIYYVLNLAGKDSLPLLN